MQKLEGTKIKNRKQKDILLRNTPLSDSCYQKTEDRKKSIILLCNTPHSESLLRLSRKCNPVNVFLSSAISGKHFLKSRNKGFSAAWCCGQTYSFFIQVSSLVCDQNPGYLSVYRIQKPGDSGQKSEREGKKHKKVIGFQDSRVMFKG